MSTTEPAFPEAKQLKQELADNIKDLIYEFEERTGFLVSRDGIELSRGGSTDSPPYKIHWVHIKIT